MPKTVQNQPKVTQERVRRLAKLIKLMGKTLKPRLLLLEKLGVDQRSFFRDIKLLRDRGIAITMSGDKYKLDITPEAAFDLLPAPQLELSMADLKHLAKGNAEVHVRVQQMLEKLSSGAALSTATKPQGKSRS
jgi:predicted DNA-binding transcriptional regulator YafY